MYQPPSSFQYVLLESSHKKLSSNVKVNNSFAGQGYSLLKSYFWNKCCYCKNFLMAVIVICTGLFFTQIVHTELSGSLYIKHEKDTAKIPGPSPIDWPSNQQLLNSLPWNKTDLPVNSSSNVMRNDHRETDFESTEFPLNKFDVSLITNRFKNTYANHSNSRNTDKIIPQSNSPLDGTEAEKSDMKLCPLIPPNLEGPLNVTLTNIPSLDVQEKAPSNFSSGGRYHPVECQARHKVAIIVPYRDRAAHLAIFLYNIHPILQRQQLDYTIFIVEQAGNGTFNRGMIKNIGSIEALKLYPFECFIFHDIDLIPEDDRNLYTCPEQPKHMSVAVSTFEYRLPYENLFGGVCAMIVQQFKTINGFSNRFWGWGGEDDDMSHRIMLNGFTITRYPADIARYAMLSHRKDVPNPHRYEILSEVGAKYAIDGLNTTNYNILEISMKPLYTFLYVELMEKADLG